VDLFIFTTGQGQFKNLQTFSGIAKTSQGNLFYYSEFNVHQDATKFTNELYGSLTRASAWESVFRVRTSYGFTQTATYGNYVNKNKTQDLVLCPVLDKDRVFVYEIERSDGPGVAPDRLRLIKEQTHLYIQSALLYTTADSERRIRVHNACYPLTNIRHLPYDYIDINALALYYARSGMAKLHLNAFNFQSVSAIVESQFQQLCQAFLRHGAGAGDNP
jgi:protein transport protein SEC24